MDWQLDLLDHTQLHTITVYKLHNSLLQLQLFLEDCCSARILTRNWNWNPLLSCQLTNSHLTSQSQSQNRPVYSRGTDHKENTSCRISPLLPREQTIKRTTVPSTVAFRLGSDHIENAGRFHCCVFIRCHSNGCQHMPYCLELARHTIITSCAQSIFWHSFYVNITLPFITRSLKLFLLTKILLEFFI
jgi:hypothetical protein